MGDVRRPQSVLFACAQNIVRSPMAEALTKTYFGRSIYVQSAGARKGEVDPFLTEVLDEIGVAIRHKPRSIEELEDLEGLNFDLVVTLAPEAHHMAMELTRRYPFEVEYWPTPDPTAQSGSREQRLTAYRAVRDMLTKKIKARFG